MDFLHYEVNLSASDTVRVTLNRQANVKLLDGHDFEKYRRGEAHNYYVGLTIVSPFFVRAPRAGHWHLAIDLGGFGGSVRASVSIV